MRLSLRYVAAAIVLPACGGAPSRAPELAAPAPVARTSASGVTAVQASPIGKMARIPSATFRMGSEAGERNEAPVHPVRVAAFDLDVTEVTVAEYAACVKAGACVPAPAVVQWPGVTGDDQQLSKDMCNENRLDRQDHAVNCVDWNLADAYCRWADKRLPTEEECGSTRRAGASATRRRAARSCARPSPQRLAGRSPHAWLRARSVRSAFTTWPETSGSGPRARIAPTTILVAAIRGASSAAGAGR